MKTNHTLKNTLPWILVIGAGIGLLAAFILTLEKIALLKDPSYQLSCSINPVLSCGSIIASPEASAFGFPNPFIGLAGYAVVVTIGMALFAGATFKKWFWQGFQIGTFLAVLFVHWLIYTSLYDIGALCLYCMVVWAVTVPIFWYTLLYNLREGHISVPKRLQKSATILQRNHGNILISWYILIIVLILENFWYYWSTLI